MSELAVQLNTALVGRYEIQRELGRGGMATVFLAQDLRHRRPVAIKVLHPELAAVLGTERFLREIETAAGLTHPHILPLHDSGSADGLLYYVMPYAEGESLRQRLEREKQLPLADALRIAREAADALDYAHRRGVLHRDIKPENILLQDGHAMVADFGIARAVVAAGGEKLTATGVVIGTPAYMSPEQLLGGRDLDGRSDQYGLACVLYEMLAGQPPFGAPTSESLAHQHLSVSPRPVTDLRPVVPRDLERALQRALAKAAADRFRTAAEFSAALAMGGEPGAAGAGAASSGSEVALDERETVARDGKHTSRGVRFRTFVGAALVLPLLAVAAWQRWGPFDRWLGGSRPHPVANKEWVLVAEFEGPPDDSLLTAAARELVSATLDQSRILASVPHEQIQLALDMAGKPPGTRVDGQVARELAYRGAVRAVVGGSIGRMGRGYSVVVRVVDAESLKVILTERAVAKGEDALIPTLGRLAERLRAGLGEKRSEIRATRPMLEAATPSFEAYRLYVQAQKRVSEVSNRAAISSLREALVLDPDFANAYRLLAAAFANVGQLDSALAACDEALRRPQRLTARQRLFTEANRAQFRGDLESALAAMDRVLESDPMDIGALSSRGLVLWGLGRPEESLESLRMGSQGLPFGKRDIHWNNEVTVLRELERLEEAREATRHIKGLVLRARLRLRIETYAGDWALVARIADTLLTRPGLDSDERVEVLSAVASARAAGGAFMSAGEVYERAERIGRGGGSVWWYQPAHARLMLAVVSRGAVPLPPDTWVDDSSVAGLIRRGLRSAIAGNAGAARRTLLAARAHAHEHWPWHGAAPVLLEAQIMMLEGKSDQAVRMLRPLAAQTTEVGFRVPYGVGVSWVRWSLADAFEQLGLPDSAAGALERVTSGRTSKTPDWLARGILVPFAHQRLVLLYARMGRIEDARRHWQAFSEIVRTPDPELEPLIAEARAALMSAEGMAKSARR